MTPKHAKQSGKTTEKAGRKAGKSAQPTSVVGPLIPQPHGGAIRPGRPANPVAGTGRPPDAIRAKLRELGYTKAIPFIDAVLTDALKLPLLGVCEACEHEQKLSEEWVEVVQQRIKANVDHRIKVSEQVLKHGLAMKELVITKDAAPAFYDCISTAIDELFGAGAADRVEIRVTQMMEAKA